MTKIRTYLRKSFAAPTKIVPHAPKQLHQLEEFENAFAKINIKEELKIEFFLSVTNYLRKCYENIIGQKYITPKTLPVMD